MDIFQGAWEEWNVLIRKGRKKKHGAGGGGGVRIREMGLKKYALRFDGLN